MATPQNLRRWLGKLVVWVFALGLVVVAPAPLFAMALAFGGKRTVFERSASPDGLREARVQFDDGGAVSGFDRIVFVKFRWNPSDEPLLSCRAFWADGEAEVHLRWLNARTLEIQHAFRPAKIQAEAARCGGVRIVIHPQPSSDAGRE